MLNLGLILLPISRDSLFQRLFSVPFELGLLYHRVIARALIFFVTLHGGSWYAYWIYHTATSSDCDMDFCAISYALSPQAVTGLCTWVCMMILAVFALEYIRRALFEWFYTIHHIFILIVGLATVHTLLAQEPWENGWYQDLIIYYLAPGVFLYIIDRILRIIRTLKAEPKIFLLDDVKSGVTILQVGTSIKFKAGQYCFLNCPKISRLQWHPYSIASGDNDETLTFVIKSMGKGTWSDRLNKLAKHIDKGGDTGDNGEFQLTFQNVISVRLDGPYGTDYLKNKPIRGKHFCFTAGGIGITPIVSVLRTIVIDQEFPLPSSVNLLWVVKSTDELLWFADFLKEISLCGDFFDDFTLNLKIFVTGRGKDDKTVNYVPITKPEASLSSFSEETSLLSNENSGSSFHLRRSLELASATQFTFESGRPNFHQELDTMQSSIKKLDPTATKTELLCCGPRGFEIPVAVACRQLTKSPNSLTFSFTSQTFML